VDDDIVDSLCLSGKDGQWNNQKRPVDGGNGADGRLIAGHFVSEEIVLPDALTIRQGRRNESTGLAPFMTHSFHPLRKCLTLIGSIDLIETLKDFRAATPERGKIFEIKGGWGVAKCMKIEI
jgi:hypothetical protein